MQAQQERDEFLRIIEKQKAQEEFERKAAEEKRKFAFSHAAGIRTQIGKNETYIKKEREAFLAEGARTRAKIDAEREKITNIKGQKISELNKLNIPEKYKFELKTKKISFWNRLSRCQTSIN